MKKLLLVGFISLWLVGCATVKTTEISNQETKAVYVKIPESLLGECLPDTPTDTETYMTMTPDERELTLSKYILTLYGTIAICNKQIQNIKLLNERIDKPKPSTTPD